MNAAEVLAQHRKSWYVQSGVATCTAPGCDWGKFGTLTQTDALFAAHQLDALRAAGYAVVELPQPSEQLWDEGDEALFASTSGTAVRVRPGRQVIYDTCWLSPGEARSDAAALLAAADAAEPDQ